MDKQLRDILIRIDTIATIVKAVASGILAAIDSSNVQSADVRANNAENRERNDQRRDADDKKISTRSNIEK